MQMIILRRTRRGTRRIEIGPFGRTILCIVLCAAFLASMVLSFQLGRQPQFKHASLIPTLPFTTGARSQDETLQEALQAELEAKIAAKLARAGA